MIFAGVVLASAIYTLIKTRPKPGPASEALIRCTPAKLEDGLRHPSAVLLAGLRGERTQHRAKKLPAARGADDCAP